MPQDLTTDIALVADCLQGSPEAWTRMVEDNRSSLLATLKNLKGVEARTGHAPEDILQKFWIQVMGRLHKYKPLAPLNVWLKMELRYLVTGYYLRLKAPVWAHTEELEGSYQPSHVDTPEEVLHSVQLASACKYLFKVAEADQVGPDPNGYRLKARHKRYVINWRNS